MTGSFRIAINYGILALISTGVNICTQDFVIRYYNGVFNIPVSIILGTGVGLLLKYILDKRYIFCFQARSIVHDTQIFALYMVMGLITTVVFWGFEFSFHFIFGTKEMRYLGGVIGLSIGYFAKYCLDKRYVFRLESV